jgi:DNA-binding PadR family transcriptional regulator
VHDAPEPAWHRGGARRRFGLVRRLGPGTPYGAIGRLERRGLVRPLRGEGRRKPYELTDAGLAEIVRRLDDSLQ